MPKDTLGPYLQLMILFLENSDYPLESYWWSNIGKCQLSTPRTRKRGSQNFLADDPSDSLSQAFHLAQVSLRSVKVGFDSNKQSKVSKEYPIL